MKKKDEKKQYKESEDVNPKSDYRDQFKRKKDTQQNAKERRQLIREIKDERDWD